MTAAHAQDHKPQHDDGKVAKGQTGSAESVDRTPDPETTSDDGTPPVSREDEPRGQPTSDRFHTEQAHRPEDGKGKGKA